MRRKKILFAMIEVGNGHKAPAYAMREGLERLYPGRFDIDVVDLPLVAGAAKLDRDHKAYWQWALSNTWFQRMAQWVTDRTGRIWHPIEAFFIRELPEKAAKYIRQASPDLIVCTHFLNVHGLLLARKRHGLDVPIWAFDSDPFDGHSFWAHRGVERMIACSAEAKARLINQGMPEEKIQILPYPVSMKFSDLRIDRREARMRLGLDQRLPTFVMSAGGEGIGRLGEYVKAVAAQSSVAQVVAICGRNAEVKAELDAFVSGYKGPTRIHVTGFVSNMPEYVAAADLVVGKPGAATTMEALIVGRPMAFISYVGENEWTNIAFCRGKGVGWYTPRPRQLASLIAELAQDPDKLAEAHRRVIAAGVRSGVLDIARELARAVDAREATWAPELEPAAAAV